MNDEWHKGMWMIISTMVSLLITAAIAKSYGDIIAGLAFVGVNVIFHFLIHLAFMKEPDNG